MGDVDTTDEQGSSSVSQEVEANAEAEKSLRLITRLVIDEHTAVEWYQPNTKIIISSIVQKAGTPRIDIDSLRGLTPTEVFGRLTNYAAVPERLAKLEAHPDVLQELSTRDGTDVLISVREKPGALSPAARMSDSTSSKVASYACHASSFEVAYCQNNSWDSTWCHTGLKKAWQTTCYGKDEAQSVVCSQSGKTRLSVWTQGCEEPESINWSNECFGHYYGGSWNVSQGWERSYHAYAGTILWVDDAFDYRTKATPLSVAPTYQYMVRCMDD